CTDCGGTVIEYDAAAGNGFCVACGTVVEENTIVNEVTFGETSTGAAMVQGSYVGHGATHARIGGPFGNRGNSESREQTIENANRKILSIASVLRLSESVSTAARRYYTLAVEHKFTKGRKSLNVVAVCLYVACRKQETRKYMLIDFSDLLQVNVFELGHTYLQFVQALELRIPLVDPSHYISRFAALLEFGDETHKVATDAVRLVQRFDRDWMTKGRRPAGICGAALFLAARMNNFRRSIEEIVQVVKIADTTLKKRLDEFKKTPSGLLTLTDFRTVWLEEEMDPPAFLKGKEEEEQKEEEEGNKRKSKKKGQKRKRVSEGKDVEGNLALDRLGMVSTFLRNEQGTLLNEALEAAAERRHAQFSVVDELLGLNEEELDAFLLSEEEVRIKERVWVEMNKEYLEAIACPDSFVRAQRRKTNTKPRDASTPQGSTAAESVQSLLKKNAKYSKRINYNALKDLFDGDEKIEGHGLYTIDDYKEGIVIEEEGGGDIGKGLAGHLGGDDDAEGEEDVGSQKGDDYGWEDTYEQEV
ncbi:hypothetical protein HETIRDRAFT_330876, partial [Heterobasidion irregulare TC 32-1]